MTDRGRCIGVAAFISVGFVATVFFLGGIRPVFMYEQNLTIDYSLCPPDPGSEAPFDSECATALLSRGPLALGLPELAWASVLGLLSLAALALVVHRRRARIVVGVLALIYLVAWGELFAWNAREISRHAASGWVIL